MSLMTILATLALAIPTNESGPVWSAITPTLMDDSVMAFSSDMPRPNGTVHVRRMPAGLRPHMGWIPYAPAMPGSTPRAHPVPAESGCALVLLSGACPYRKTGAHPRSSRGQAFSGICAKVAFWGQADINGRATPAASVG